MASVPMYAVYLLIVCYATAKETEVKVAIGDTAKLRCNVPSSSTGRPVTWVKEGPEGQELISMGQLVLTVEGEKYDVTVTATRTQFTLGIKDAGDADEGTYRCLGGERDEAARVLASFKVVVGMEQKGDAIKEVRVHRGDRVELPCTVTEIIGIRTIMWMKEGLNRTPLPVTVGLTTLVQDPGISVRVSSWRRQWTLVIRNAHDRDQGTYTCQISGKTRRVFASFKLVVDELSNKRC